MPVVTLTELTLRHLQPVPGRQVIYLDKNGPTGFGVRVSEKGARSFVLTYGAQRKRVKLGDVGLIPLSKAREKAKTLLAERQLNGEPSLSLSFEDALTLFLKVHCARNNRTSTAKETERLLRRHFLPKLRTRSLDSIKTEDVVSITDSLLSTPSEANHAHTAAATLFRFCVRRRYIPHSPLEGLCKPAKAQSRERVLTDAELKAVLLCARQSGVYGQLIELLMLSGQRLGQIASLRGEWINHEGQVISFPAQVMKGNQAHFIPYGTMAAAILNTLPTEGLLFPTERGTPFNNWSSSHKEFLTASKVAHFTRHDLRRTYSTGMASLGVPPHITERLLAHKGGVISGVAAIYNRFQYAEPMKEAVLKWEAHLDTLTAAR